MTHPSHAVLVAGLTGALVACALVREPPAEPTAVHVGTFDSRAIAVAHTNSDHFRRDLSALEAQLADARARGDAQAVARIEALGPAMQHTRHLQAFSTAPVHDLLADVADRIPGVAAAAGVDLIVSRWEIVHLAPDAVTVDVTGALVALFDPDERALGWIEDLEHVEPVSAAELEGH